jgi:CBS domain-containing protein
MKCATVMKQEVRCILPTDTVQHAADQMHDQILGFLPVCDSEGNVLGTLTDRDIAMRIVRSGKPATTPVEEVMTHEVVACRPEDDIRRAHALMAENKKSRIMCLDDGGHLVGVISLSDLAQRDQAGASATLREVTAREAEA